MRVSEAKKLARLSEWRHLIACQKASGLSVRGWCAQNDMNEQQFYYRLRQVREAVLDTFESDSNVQLVRLTGIESMGVTQSAQHRASIVVRRGKTLVEFSEDIDVQRIASFVRALEP
jgi:hypothetical protein